MKAFIAKHGEIATSVLAIMVVLAGAVALVGGDLPPWPPARDFRELKMNVEGILSERDATRCDDWNRRLSNAFARFTEGKSLVDLEIIETSRMEIRRIPNCRER
jgi:hypothetical protein